MILTKTRPYAEKQICLHGDSFDNYTWNLLSELLDFPFSATSVDLTITGVIHEPRLFSPEECEFIPVDNNAILERMD